MTTIAAHQIRHDRAQLKRDLKAGVVDWRSVILEPPACLGDMLLSEVLTGLIPGVRRGAVEALGRGASHVGLTLTTRAYRSSMQTRVWLVTAAEPFVSHGLRVRRGMP
jgi:hypothetical protein